MICCYRSPRFMPINIADEKYKGDDLICRIISTNILPVSMI